MRQWLNKNPVVGTVGAVLLLVFSLGFVLFYVSGGSTVATGGPWYYLDTNTGQVVSLDANGRLPPLKTDSKPESGQPVAVRAFIYACGGCKDYTGMTVEKVEQAGATVGMLQKWPDRVRELAKGGNLDQLKGMQVNYRIVRSPEYGDWVKVTSREGRRIDQNERPRCEGGRRAQICTP